MREKIQWMDTLRCFAFILILIYHFFPGSLPGGFLGVDLLFVLSGFLVTGTTLDELGRKGTFNRKGFFKKRILRLVPALVLMVGLSTLLLLFSNPDLRVDLGRQTAGALGFMTNWYEILSGGSYETQFIPHIYVHSWSLAIEMHFYLLWGLLLSLLIGFSMGKSYSQREGRERSELQEGRRQGRARSRILLLSLFGIVLFTLAQWYFLGKEAPNSFLYFSDLCRAGSFFFGSLAAALSGLHFVSRPFIEKKRRRGPLLDLLIFLAGGGVLVLFSLYFTYESPQTYFFGFLLTDLVSMFMVLAARGLHEKTREGLEPGLIGTFSHYSYGLYLFHYPIYVIFNMKGSHSLAVGLSLSLGLLLSVFSEKVFAPLWTNKEDLSPLKNQKRKSLLIKALALIGVFVGVVSFLSPKMLSLEKDLWAQSLRQDLDQTEDAFQKVQGLANEEKEREEEEKASAQLENQGITVIGDSVALGMRPYFLEAFSNINVDGEVSRFLHHGDEMILQMEKEGGLKKNVVICLGNNVYPSFAKDARRICQVLPKGKRLIFIAPYDNRVDASSDVEKYAKFLPSLEKEFSYVTVANWNRVAKEHPEYFTDTDGVHFYAKKGGIAAYIDCLKEAMTKSVQKPVKK